MNLVKVLKKSVIDSQIYVSLMGSLLAAFFMLEQNTFRYPTFFLLFITYFCGYLYTKYQNSKFFRPVLVINFIAGIVCAVLIIHNHNIDRLYKWLVIVILGLFYNSSFLHQYIRKIPLMKVFYVGLVWGLVNSWLSFHEWNLPVFFISFLLVTALVLPFDIRDMDYDDIVTFPRLIGVQKTKYLAYSILSISGILSLIFLKQLYSLAFLISIFCTFFFVFFADRSKPDTYFSFGVESCSSLPFLFLILLEYF